MEPPDRLEKGIRLGCGFVFGCFIGFLVALQFLAWDGLNFGVGVLVGGLVCAFSALRYGDRFWLGLSRFINWGAWPSWREWWWRR